jgi:hypothetical protein
MDFPSGYPNRPTSLGSSNVCWHLRHTTKDYPYAGLLQPVICLARISVTCSSAGLDGQGRAGALDFEGHTKRSVALRAFARRTEFVSVERVLARVRLWLQTDTL